METNKEYCIWLSIGELEVIERELSNSKLKNRIGEMLEYIRNKNENL